VQSLAEERHGSGVLVGGLFRRNYHELRRGDFHRAPFAVKIGEPAEKRKEKECEFTAASKKQRGKGKASPFRRVKKGENSLKDCIPRIPPENRDRFRNGCPRGYGGEQIDS